MNKQSNIFASNVVERLATLLPERASLHEPRLEGNETKYVNNCVQSGWVSTVGSYVDRFETELAAYTGAKHAVAIVNGTAALHLALVVAGVKDGDEVLLPSLTFVATANAVSYCRATPHLVDCEKNSFGVDAEKLDKYLAENTALMDEKCMNKHTGAPVTALVCMHALGHPADLDKLTAVCKKYKLLLVEDAAESLGSYYKGRHTGNDGIISSLSFNGNKILTTGGGGAILTNDCELAVKAKHLSTTAKTPHAWEFNHDEVGYNYRMPNVNAALGCAQLEQMPHFLETKRALTNKYIELFDELDGLNLLQEPDYARSNYWLNAIVLDEEISHNTEALFALTNETGLMTRALWTPMHKLTMFEKCPRMDLSVTEDLTSRTICIPSSSILGDKFV
jgi:perosamine synthetase